MTEIHDPSKLEALHAIFSEPMPPCPPGVDATEWERSELDRRMHQANEMEQNLYQECLAQGASDFQWPEPRPCPPESDPVEWERHELDNAIHRHQAHVQATVEKFLGSADECDIARDNSEHVEDDDHWYPETAHLRPRRGPAQ